MADATAKMIKELRDMTDVGMMGTRKALVEVEGDMEKTVDFLHENGTAKATKEDDHTAAEGLVNVATVGNVATIVEVNSKTGFVSKNETFRDLVRGIVTKVTENKPAAVEEAMAIKAKKDMIESDLIGAITVAGEKVSLRRFKAIEKTDNTASGAYSHMGSRIAALTIIGSIADEEVAEDVATHIATIDPYYVNESQTPQGELEHEEAVLVEQALNEGKPTSIVERMVVGRLQKFRVEIALVGQPFVKGPDITVEKFIASGGGEVKSLVRFEIGEDTEKREDNLADEAMSQIKN